MDMARVSHGNYERVVSSGMTFNGRAPSGGKADKNAKLKSILLSRIEEEMELSVRSQNFLKRSGIELIGQLVQKNEAQLLGMDNFGRKSLHEIVNVLSGMGLSLEMNLDFPPWNVDDNGKG
jgi:DNA-directed RNA polymerase alpha subunit